MTIQLHIGDVRAVLAKMEPGSVDMVASSPPFMALRSYLPADHPLKALEIGSEPTPADFLDTLLDVTEACERVLAPHGSHVFELGDTMAGSGGAGRDYNEGGLREDQPGGWRQANARRDKQQVVTDRQRTGGRDRRADEAEGLIERRNGRSAQVQGWPLDKSMCVIPHLYAASLAYGRNLLHPEREVDPWRVRNIVAWIRSNPPVGSLGGGTPELGTGDARFRPATSYLTIACKNRSRWFDLNAVRVKPSENTHARTNGRARYDLPSQQRDGNWDTLAAGNFDNPAGAPPLDWWLVNSGGGFRGAHYATFPPELLVRPIQSMCPRRVCRSCGKPSRRITAAGGSYADLLGSSWADKDEGRAKAATGARSNHAGQPTGVPHIQSADYTTLGWTTCGCAGTEEGAMWAPGWTDRLVELRLAQKAIRKTKPETPKRAAATEEARRCAEALGKLWCGRMDGFHHGDGWRPGVVLDPFAGSGTTLLVASELSRDAIGIDIDERAVALVEERFGPLMASQIEVVGTRIR